MRQLLFSEKLGESKYAIALTRVDLIAPDELPELVKSFLDLVGVKASVNNHFKFDENIPFYIQEIGRAHV